MLLTITEAGQTDVLSLNAIPKNAIVWRHFPFSAVTTRDMNKRRLGVAGRISDRPDLVSTAV